MKFISKLYFNTFKKNGNLRLMFVISCLLASVSLLIITPEVINRIYFYRVYTSIYSLSYLWNYLWVIFWFYFPFLIILPIKFVIEGYQQDKKGKNKKL